jgi:hypothetical protein
MSDVAYRDQAAGWARDLIARESRGPGDTENAMRRLEARYGIAFGALWALRYRAPRDIMASVYFRLRAAYDDARERQLRALQHDIIVAKATRPDRNCVRAAEALVERAIQAGLTSGRAEDPR